MSQLIGGDAIGGDKIGGDKITGDKITIGDLTNSVVNLHKRALTAAEEARIADDLERQRLAEGVQRLASSLQTRLKRPAFSGGPFKDLLPYDIGDAELFFGRRQAIEDLLTRLERGRLTVLHAESGAGKTSLLQAGVAPLLLAQGHLALALRPRHENPALSVQRAFLPDPSQAPGLAATPLQALLRSVGEILGPRRCIYLFLDQFEEFFSLEVEERRSFRRELAACLNDPGLEARWMLALRAEAFSGLAELEEAGIAPFRNAYRLNRMGREEARQAIQEPAQRSGLDFQPELVEALLDQLGSGGEISPVHLSLVCSALTTAVAPGQPVSRQSLLDQGGVEGILRGYLQRQIGSLPLEQRDPARRVLRTLVSADGRRAAKSSERLTSELHHQEVGPDVLSGLLGRLVERRLIVAHENDAGVSYELAHDYLLGEIELDPAEQARKAAQELLDQEMRAHQRHGALIDAERLTLIEGYRVELLVSDEAAALLAKSRAAVDQETAEREAQRQRELEQAQRLAETRRQRAMVLAAGLAAAVILAVLSLWFYRQSNANLGQANAANTQSAMNLSQANTAGTQAALNLDAAQDNAATAQAEAYSRATQEAIAVEQAQIALARQLAAQSQLLPLDVGTRTLQSGLLAAEALRRGPGIDADQATRRLLDLGSRPIARVAKDGFVNAVAFSPDGRWFVTGSEMGIARVRDATSGEEIARFTHDESVQDIDFSPDGRRVVTGSIDGIAIVWEAANGREVSRLTHEAGVTNVAFSTDGRWVVSGSDDGVARVWEATSGLEISHVTHDSMVVMVAFSLNGEWVVSASIDGNVFVWDAASGRLIKRIVDEFVSTIAYSPTRHRVATGTGTLENNVRVWDVASGSEAARWVIDHRITVMAFSMDGGWIVTGSEDGIIQVWEAMSGRELAHMDVGVLVSAVGFSPNGQWVVTGSLDGTARVWETMSGRELARMVQDLDVATVAFSPDGRRVVSVSENGVGWVWEVVNGRDMARMAHDKGVSGVGFSPDGHWVVSGSRDNTARVWEAASGREIARMLHGGPVTAVAFSPEGRWVVSGSGDGTARVWEAASGKEATRMVHDGGVTGVAFSPNGRWIISGSDDNTARVWEAMSGQEVARVVHNDGVTGVAFSPDGRWVASGSLDETIRVWEVTSGQEVSRMEDVFVFVLALSPDGRLIASGGSDRTAHIWEVASGRELTRVENEAEVFEGEVDVVAFSPDSRWVVSGGTDKIARVWEAVTGREVARIEHDWSVLSAAFSPDGNWVVSGSYDGTARVWDAASGREVARMVHEGSVHSAVFSPDGRWVVSGSEDGTARVWLWRPEDLLAELCSRLTRNFTQDEWAQYLGDEPYRATCPNLPAPTSAP